VKPDSSWSAFKTVLLAVEILSPSTSRADRFTKRRLFQEVGVPVYWIVDADGLTVRVWTPDAKFPLAERERLVWHPPGARAPLMLALEELLRPI
jgi:Uma2 family endonuclease